jgi:hypothetical protein
MTTLLHPPAVAHYTSPIPFIHERIGAAALYCSDGRYGEQMDDFLHNALLLPHYDRVAIPGGAAALAGHLLATRERIALERQILFLIDAHELDTLVFIAHENCGFYKQNLHPHKLKAKPLQQHQADDLKAAAQTLRLSRPHLEISAYLARRTTNELVGFVPIPL